MELNRGEVFLVDLGMAAKTRPCVVLSIPKADSRRNMTVIAPMTTEVRGGECEVAFPKPRWLNENSVVNLVGLVGVDSARIGRFLGRLTPDTMSALDDRLARMFGL